MGKENDLNVNFFKVDSVFTCPSDADVKSPSPFGPSVPAKDNTIACKLLYRKTLVLEWAQIINIFMLQHLRTKVEVQLCDTADVTLVSKSDFFGAGEEVAKKTPSKKLRALPRIAQSLKPLLPSFHQKQSNPRRVHCPGRGREACDGCGRRGVWGCLGLRVGVRLGVVTAIGWCENTVAVEGDRGQRTNHGLGADKECAASRFPPLVPSGIPPAHLNRGSAVLLRRRAVPCRLETMHKSTGRGQDTSRRVFGLGQLDGSLLAKSCRMRNRSYLAKCSRRMPHTNRQEIAYTKRTPDERCTT